jgi:hypothetical protein
LRNIGRTPGDYLLPSTRGAHKPPSPDTRVHAPAVVDAKVHAALAAELDLLRLRARALTTANTNLRRRLKELESQSFRKAGV